jgi:hypothetical protein
MVSHGTDAAVPVHPGDEMMLRTSILPGWGVALAVAISFGASAPAAFAQDATMSTDMTPPPVPTSIEVPAGNHVFRVGHAVGTQNYVCVPSHSGFKFVLFRPQATLFSADRAQTATHYFSPNPFEAGTIRATW